MGWTVVIVAATLVAIAAFLIGTLVKHILDERREEHVRGIWKNFALSLAFVSLFLISWVVQGVAEWSVYEREQRAHDEPVAVSDFVLEFGQSTLENWQSEFLQLFSFVVLSAVFIHRGSGESKDGQDRIEAMVKEIHEQVVEVDPPSMGLRR